VSKRQHVYLHSEDLDGWLSPPNEPLLSRYLAPFRRLQAIRLETETGLHRIEIVLNSGKSPAYLEAQARCFHGRYVIACNGGAWRACGGATKVFGPPTEDFARLRSLLDLAPGSTGVQPMRLDGRIVPVAIEEGKQADGADITLTFFPEPEPVAHRWRFPPGVDRHTLRWHLSRLIARYGLALHVLEPHGDGAVDVVRIVEGVPVTKATLPRLAAEMFPGAVLHLTHGGDGSNDLPAMGAGGVTPLTAINCSDTLQVAARKGGVVAGSPAPEGGAVLECYQELARRGFYGPLSAQVLAACALDGR